MMYIRSTILFACLLLSIEANAQDAWKKVMLKGKITYHSNTKTKEFDDEGNVIGKSEYELTGSTDQVLTFYPGRFQLMAKDPQKLKEFNEANIHHVFFGEVYDQEKSKPIRFPVEFSSQYKEWGRCENSSGLILMKTTKANGVSQVTATKTFLSMIQTRSQGDVDEDKMIAKAMDKFAQLVMEEKRENDIKAGKTINEDDYFVPANLYNPNTFGLFLFTNWWSTDFQNLPMVGKHNTYDCTTKSWKEYTADKGVDLYISDNNRKLMENYNEDGEIRRFQYSGISPKQLDDFIKKPEMPTAFTGRKYAYYKSGNSESESIEIITLTLSLDEKR